MRVVIFIGHHKVGSTSLQDYFARNAALFASRGILYPYTNFDGAASLVDDLLKTTTLDTRKKTPNIPVPKFLESHVPINIREPHNALAFSMLSDAHEHWRVPRFHREVPDTHQMMHSIRQQVEFLKPHTVVLISEVMANFGAELPEGIAQIKDLFDKADFTVYASLRRIDQYIASWHGQRLWFGAQLRPLRKDGLKDHIDSIHFDYTLMVEKWIEKIPEAKLILRDYSDALENGGSVKDFLQSCRIKVPPKAKSDRRVNDSYHRALYEIVRLANIEFPRMRAHNFRTNLQNRQSALKLPKSDDIELFGRRVRRRLFSKFKPINKALGKHMDRRVFFNARKEILKPAKIPELEAVNIAIEQLQQNIDWFGDPKVQKFVANLQHY